MKAARQLASPLIAIFAVNRKRILATDREQSFDDDISITFQREPRVADNRQWLTNQRLEAEVAGQAVECRAGTIFQTDEFCQDASNDTLATACRADHEQNFVQIGPAADDV